MSCWKLVWKWTNSQKQGCKKQNSSIFEWDFDFKQKLCIIHLLPKIWEHIEFNIWTLHILTIPEKTILICKKKWCTRFLKLIVDNYTHQRESLSHCVAHVNLYFITAMVGINTTKISNSQSSIENKAECSSNTKLSSHSNTSNHELSFISKPLPITWKHVFNKTSLIHSKGQLISTQCF